MVSPFVNALDNMNTKICCQQIPSCTIRDQRVQYGYLAAGSKLISMENSSVATVGSKQPLRASISPHELTHFKSHEVQLAEKLKFSISRRLRRLGEDSCQELDIIDTIQRLSIDHLFQQEIDEVLCRQASLASSCSNGLHEVSLRFRLLRQQGYNISADTFDDFLCQDMKFNEELENDTQGLVSLFEASEMRMRGERILDEANVFSKRILSESLDGSQTMLVQNAFKYPLQKSLARFKAHDFFSTLTGAKGWRNELQELARIDINAAQIVYQSEILHISNWWKKLGLSQELKFARDQPLKWHMWSLAMIPDPSLSEQRVEITKAISFIYVIDDIFDVYGKPEDLSLFTEAVSKWEIGTLELPDYMKICLEALFDLTNQISQRIWFKYGSDPIYSLQKAWIDLINAFLFESKWFAAGHLPSTTEYLRVATTTSGVQLAFAHMYSILGGGSECNGQVLDMDYTRIASSTARILRLWDDLGSSEDEKQDGHDGSYINCYINEGEGVSIDAAKERVVDLISDAWKSLNQECVQLPPYPFSSMKVFTGGCLNLARMVPLMYSHDENHSLPDLDKFVTSLLHQRF